MPKTVYTTAERYILDNFPDIPNFGIRSLTFVNKKTGDIIENAISLDSNGDLHFKDKTTEVSLKELITRSKGYAEEKNQNGDPVLYFFDNQNQKITLGALFEKLFLSNLTKGVKWFTGRVFENFTGECLKMDEYLVENFFTKKTRKDETDPTKVETIRIDNQSWKNIWHDVPCMEIITDDYVDNKYGNISTVIHYRVKADRPIATGFRIYDATADIELARNVHMAGGTDQDEFVTYSVPVEYQGPMPDTPFTTESECKKITFRDLQNIQVKDGIEIGTGIASQDGYALVPLTQHVIKVQWCTCELAIQYDNIGNRVGEYNREFFPFGDTSLDMVIFDNNKSEQDRTQLADTIEINSLNNEQKTKKEFEVTFDIVPFNDADDYSVTIGTNANFNAWVTVKNERGFTVKWDRNPTDGIIDWSLYHSERVENELDRLTDSTRVINHYLFGDQEENVDFCREVERVVIDTSDCTDIYVDNSGAYIHDLMLARIIPLINKLEDDFNAGIATAQYIISVIADLENLLATYNPPFVIYEWVMQILAVLETWKQTVYTNESIRNVIEAQDVCTSAGYTFDVISIEESLTGTVTPSGVLTETLIDELCEPIQDYYYYYYPICDDIITPPCPYEYKVTIELNCGGEFSIEELIICSPIELEIPPIPDPPPPPPPESYCELDLRNFVADIPSLEECECCDCCDTEGIDLKWKVDTTSGSELIPETDGHIYFIEDDYGNRRYSTDKNDLKFTLDQENETGCDVDYTGTVKVSPFDTRDVRIFVNNDLGDKCTNLDAVDYEYIGIEKIIYQYLNILEGADCDVSFLPETMVEVNLEDMYGYNHSFKRLDITTDLQYIQHTEEISEMLEDRLDLLETDKKQRPDNLPVQNVSSNLLLLEPKHDDEYYGKIFATNGIELKMFDPLNINDALIRFDAFLGSPALGYSFVWFDPRPNVLVSDDDRPLYPGYNPIYSKTTKQELLEYIYSAVYPTNKVPVFPNFKVGDFVVNGALYNPVFDIRNYRLPGIYTTNSFQSATDGDLFRTKDIFEVKTGLRYGQYLKTSDGENNDYVVVKRDTFNTIPYRTSIDNGIINLVTPSGIKFEVISEETYNLNINEENP